MRLGLRTGAVGLALLLVGCGGGSTVVVERAGGTVMLSLSTEPKVFMMAIIEGTLTRTDRGCLAAGSSADTLEVLELPFGTRLAGDGQSVDVPGRGVVRLGDSFTGGGGHGGADGLNDLPPECQDATGILVWENA